jgi:hypothetical protein
MTSFGKSIVGVIIIGLIVLGGYFYTRTTDIDENSPSTEVQNTVDVSTLPSSSTTQETPAKPTSSGKKMAFSEFIKQGGSYTCTVNQLINNVNSQGTVFISGDKVRGEFSTTAQGQSMTMSFLTTGGYTYTWTSMMPTMGFKMKNTASANTTNNTAAMSSAWDASAIGDYTCDTWSVDPAKFVVPTTVTFKEMAQ